MWPRMTEAACAGQPARVLMIGAGRRAKNNFLPVLTYLETQGAVEIVGVHARTAANLYPVAEHWRIPGFTSTSEIDFSKVEAVAISVPPAQNGPVLQSLEPHASRLTILIDTPVAFSRGELALTDRLLKKFKRVFVAEDYMNFPPFELMRMAVKGGLVGNVMGVTLTNIGYMYHGLALVRSFCGFGRARSTWKKSAGTYGTIVGYNFANGFKGIVIGPYRRESTSGITVEGTRGILSDFPGDKAFEQGAGRSIYILKYDRAEEGYITRVWLDGAGPEYAIDLPQLGAMYNMDIVDRSDLNLLRGCGLMRVFQALNEVENINHSYGRANAFYDSFAPRLAAKGLLAADPLTWIGSDAVSLLRAVSR